MLSNKYKPKDILERTHVSSLSDCLEVFIDCRGKYAMLHFAYIAIS